jgi:hypothetical protein
VLELNNHNGGVSYLPGRLATKHPAKALEIRILGPGLKDMGPVRRCHHGDLVRIVALCTNI